MRSSWQITNYFNFLDLLIKTLDWESYYVGLWCFSWWVTNQANLEHNFYLITTLEISSKYRYFVGIDHMWAGVIAKYTNHYHFCSLTKNASSLLPPPCLPHGELFWIMGWSLLHVVLFASNSWPALQISLEGRHHYLLWLNKNVKYIATLLFWRSTLFISSFSSFLRIIISSSSSFFLQI